MRRNEIVTNVHRGGGIGLSITRLSEIFKRFASVECKGSCSLYEFLSYQIAEDDELLSIAEVVPKGQPVPNLFFGAVHYLLLKGSQHPLRSYYPSITESVGEMEDSFRYFKDFCLKNKEEISLILQTKRVQTNEVRRCSYLYPSFNYMYELTKKPLALIEIGTSAGLQLFWDQYAYSYGTDEFIGNTHSNVHIHSEIRGDRKPLLSAKPAPVTMRTGVDLRIVDLSDPEEFLWLKALIWPSHHERRKLFEESGNFLKEQTVTLIEGDGVELLPELVKEVPQEVTLCVFHTHVANQMPIDVRKRLFAIIEEIGQERDVFHLYNNMKDGDLHLDYFIDGVENTNTIAKTDGHGRWFTWLL